MGVSCSSIFVIEGIVYDVAHSRLEQIRWDESAFKKEITAFDSFGIE